MKTFDEALEFLSSLNNLSGKENYKLPSDCAIYLRRLQPLLDVLKKPEQKIPHYIHVTGTSGKGSVCIYLSNILQEAHQKQNIGLLVSPHISRITERWSINNHPMSDSEFVKNINNLKNIFSKYLKTTSYGSVSFLEAMTAIGLKYFANNHVKWAVVEVGCGGEHDSTNIIPHKDLAIITNVGLDHVPLLGVTKPQIALEKSGIITSGITVFTGEKDKRVLKVIKKQCQNKKATLKIIDINKYQIIKHDFNGIDFRFENKIYHLHTLGIHQIHNAILAIKSAEYLKIPYEKIYAGLNSARLPLRTEIINFNPIIILDGAHNTDKITATVNTLRTLSPANSHLHLVVGFSGNKNTGEIIKTLASLGPKSIAPTRFTKNIFRKCANPNEIAKQFKKLVPKAKVEFFIDPLEAYDWSRKQAKKDDILLVTGSIFLGGEIRAKLTKGQF